jgi:hypothetical protein
MSFLIVVGVTLACVRAFMVLKGPTYRGRERRWSGAGGRGHPQR